MIGVLAGAIVFAIAPAAAHAATRYATPNPKPGASCSQSAPCGLVTAVGGATSGDTIIVGAGTYGSLGTPLPPLADDDKTRAIRGAVIGPGRPVIHARLSLTGPGSTLSDLELVSNSGGLVLGFDTSATRIISRSGGGDACSLAGGVALSDSVCRKTGNSSSALTVSDTGSVVRNVTVVGDDYGLFHFPGDSSAINSIFRGSFVDIQMHYVDSSLSATNSEYATTVTSANGAFYGTITATGTVSAAPAFAGPEDFHTTAGSPGIDAGLDDPANSALDLDGFVRVAGAHIDIGAYEFGSAPPPSLPGGDPGTATACPGGTSATVRCGTSDGRLVMIGTGASERFVGTTGADTILGGGGKDTIYPSKGDDTVDAGPGADYVASGTGSDTIKGGTGNDHLVGSSGADTLQGQGGRDKLSGGSGRDKLSGGSGRDRLRGGTGRDRLNGGTGRDSMSGMSGNDRLTGGSARDSVYCGKGSGDRVFGASADRVSSSCELLSG